MSRARGRVRAVVDRCAVSGEAALRSARRSVLIGDGAEASAVMKRRLGGERDLAFLRVEEAATLAG